MEFLNLDHRLLPVPVDYVRELYDYISELYTEIEDLNGKLAKAGNHFYQRDAAKMGAEWNNLNIEFGKMQREKIENEAKLQAEIDRLTFLNQQLAADLDIAEARLKGMVAVEVVDNKPSRMLPERAANGTFKAPVKSKEQLAFEYSSQGLKNTEIAGLLDVSPDTVARYIRKVNQQKAESERLRQIAMNEENEKKSADWEYQFETYGFTF